MTELDFKIYISLFATLISLSSAFISCLNYRRTVKENERNKKDLFISNCVDKFDLLFVEFNSFAEKYISSSVAQQDNKNIYREKILYLENSIGSKFYSNDFIEIKSKYADFSVALSDLLYTDEITSSDLIKIRLLIQSLKRKIEVL